MGAAIIRHAGLDETRVHLLEGTGLPEEFYVVFSRIGVGFDEQS